MRALPEFVCGEAVAIRGEGLLDWWNGVGSVEPGRGVKIGFYVGYLGVDGFWEEEIDAADEVLDEALGELVGVFRRHHCSMDGGRRTVVLKTCGALETRDNVHMRSGIRYA
jgi:hypothetical protein